MDPIYLYPAFHEKQYAITLEGSLLKTPSGKVYSSFNKDLIENTIYDLQKYSDIQIDENNSLIGEPLEALSFYTLFCSQLDVWNTTDKKFCINQIINGINKDPFTNISAGPERGDQLHQWRSIINLLDKKGYDFDLLQYYNRNPSEVLSLAEEISKDFNNSSPAEKSIFWNLLQHGSIIASWAFTYQGLNEVKVTTALIASGYYLMEIDVTACETNSTYNEIKKKFYKEILESFDLSLKFKELSMDELVSEESISLEYKASFRTPYPNYPDQAINDNGQTIYKLGNKEFKSKKEIHKFIEKQSLKTLVAFMNTNGGKLIIGVHEKDNHKDLVGLDREGFESMDKYTLHISQQITNRIGKIYHGDYINIDIKTRDDKSYCIIECKKFIPGKNQIPVFLDDKYCYRRTGPRSDLVNSGPELANFINERQKS